MPNAARRILTLTGTDTGIGKTWVACHLARAWRSAGLPLLAIKLVETGTTPIPAETEDGVLLARAAGQTHPAAALRRYRSPVAAAEAADREGKVFDLEAAVQELRGIAAETRVTLVEGAGGLLAPLTWEHTILDVARWLNADAIVVAADRLGTINHTLLTVSALERTGVRCAAVVMNAVTKDDNDESIGSNADSLRRLRPDLLVIDTNTGGWEAQLLAALGL